MSPSRSHTFDLTALLPGDYYCGGCAERVCGSAVEIEGVVSASCDLEEGVLVIEYLPRTIDLGELEARVRRLALEETDSVGHAAYPISYSQSQVLLGNWSYHLAPDQAPHPIGPHKVVS